MKVLVVGATGRTGRLVVSQAVAAGHAVRALSRSVRAEDVPAGVEVLAGDATDPAVAAAAMEGVDAVVVALSMVRTSDSPWARITTPHDLHTQAARALLAAAQAAGVRRYLTVSAHGVGPSRPRAGWAFVALVHSSNIGVAYTNLAHAEALVMASDLDWTIARPTRLTSGPGAGAWQAATDLRTSSAASIPREDVARFLVACLEEGAWSRAAVSVTGRG